MSLQGEYNAWAISQEMDKDHGLVKMVKMERLAHERKLERWKVNVGDNNISHSVQ